MKLIPMTDYVLEQSKRYFDGHIVLNQYEELTRSYANFLKQPLALWMFVPCDEDGNVLEEPEYFKYHSQFNRWEDSKFDGYFDDENDFKDWEKECIKYIKSKERCLFEGFTIERAEWANTNILDLVVNNDSLPVLSYDSEKKHIFDSDSSEQYIMFNVENLLDYYKDLTLTETALKTL